MYPHTITVINKYNNRGKVEYYFTVIENVLWQDKQGVKTGSEVRYTDNRGYIQIPYTKGSEVVKHSYKSRKQFLNQEEWLRLEDKTKAWTLKPDDFVVKGALPYNRTQLDIKIKDIPNLRTIESVEDIDYSIYINSHYGVTLR